MIHRTGDLGTATFSDCERYRYTLTRTFAAAEPETWVTWLMLNPSTADHDQNDHTITKCIRFSQLLARDRMIAFSKIGVRIVNLFAFRATDPDVCRAEPKKIGGTENDLAIAQACELAHLTGGVVVCAWGAQSWARDRAAEMKRMLVGDGIPLHCIGRTKDGSPRHPLMVAYAQPIERWP